MTHNLCKLEYLTNFPERIEVAEPSDKVPGRARIIIDVIFVFFMEPPIALELSAKISANSIISIPEAHS